MKHAKATKMPMIKRIGAIGLVLLVMVVFFFAGKDAAERRGAREGVEAGREGRDLIAEIFMDLFLGFFFAVAGTLIYLLTLITQCFTFSYRKPVFPRFKVKLYIVNIIFLICLVVALGSVFHLITGVFSAVAGSGNVRLDMVMLISLIVSMFVVYFLGVWTPTERALIRKRLSALGIPAKYLDHGILMGISDPKKSSLTKLTTVEEDVGMLWIRNDSIVYRGDSQKFLVHRPELLEVERKADSGSLAALGGAVHIILRMLKNGEEERVRLHPMGCWTPRGVARVLDELAEKIEEWKAAGTQEAEERVPAGEEENV